MVNRRVPANRGLTHPRCCGSGHAQPIRGRKRRPPFYAREKSRLEKTHWPLIIKNNPMNRYQRPFRIHRYRLLTCRPRKAAGTMKRTSLHTPEYAALVALLRDLRLEAGLSQAETAEKVDRPQTWLSALEVGGRGLDILHVRELVAVYGLDFPDFATRLEATIKAQPYRPPRRRRADAKSPAVQIAVGIPTQPPAKPLPVAVAKPVAEKPDAKAPAKTRAKPAAKRATTSKKKPGRKPSR